MASTGKSIRRPAGARAASELPSLRARGSPADRRARPAVSFLVAEGLRRRPVAASQHLRCSAAARQPRPRGSGLPRMFPRPSTRSPVPPRCQREAPRLTRSHRASFHPSLQAEGRRRMPAEAAPILPPLRQKPGRRLSAARHPTPTASVRHLPGRQAPRRRAPCNRAATRGVRQ